MRTHLRNILIAFAFVASLSAVNAGLHAQNVAISSPTPPAATAAQDSNAVSSQVAGEALFGTYCATCHEGPGANPQAPGRDVMRRMSAEQILESLERGAMRTRAAERSRAQRRALAEYLSGKPLGADSGGSIPKSAFCAAAPAPRADALGGPAWNGWGNGIANARFQSADAAGLKANDLSQLKLKWAFGFPGATSAGTQPVVIGGRVYVATAEGDVYVLDAKTGCVHWTLRG